MSDTDQALQPQKLARGLVGYMSVNIYATKHYGPDQHAW